QAEDGIRDRNVTGVQTCALPIYSLQGTAYPKIYCHTMRGMRQVPAGQQFSATTDWTKATLEMDVPRDTYEIWAWCAWDAPVPGWVHWDDCALEVVGPAEIPDPPLKAPR